MLNFHGMPSRNMTALVQGEDLRHIEKRIVHVICVADVVETPFLEGARPIRTQLVKVAFDDGTTRMGCVTL